MLYYLILKVLLYLCIFSDGDSQEEITSNNRIDIVSNGTVIINSITSDDKGNYICEANNGIGNVIVSPFSISVSGKQIKNINCYLFYL